MLSFRGRMARASWWGSSLLAALAFLILYVFLESVAGTKATWILYPPFAWIVLALAVKRLHDAGGGRVVARGVRDPGAGAVVALLEAGAQARLAR
jgi:uncharacterized membrane protein YhaH (DUF805 family)